MVFQHLTTIGVAQTCFLGLRFLAWVQDKESRRPAPQLGATRTTKEEWKCFES